MKRLIIGLSGADGVSIGVRLLHILHGLPGVETHLVATPSAERNLLLEGCPPLAGLRELADFSYAADDMAAVIASGSFVTDGMIVVPCSMKTLAGIVSGYADNLLLRAADVCLKEGRKLVLVPRETPLSLVHLRNLKAAAEAGCAIVPPMLTFYGGADTIEKQIDHIIGKIFLRFGLSYKNGTSWDGVP